MTESYQAADRLKAPAFIVHKDRIHPESCRWLTINKQHGCAEVDCFLPVGGAVGGWDRKNSGNPFLKEQLDILTLDQPGPHL